MTATNSPPESEVPERTPKLSQDVAFELLSCRRRRYVIHCLKQRSGPVEFRELVTRVAAWENDVPPSAVTYEERMRVYTALRQSHLPKLDDGGVVSYDSDRGTVALTEAASELEVYLEVVPHDDIRWSTYYAGLGCLCTGFVLALWAGIPLFSAIPPLAGTTLVTAVFTVSAVFHTRHDSRIRLDSDGPTTDADGGVPWR
ncbi:hypothetical protein [Natrialba sp. INN-245]|uniref:DUF7344 domain-containing protein n=1 Tax=Natrialba sp. INN-245 TaxID=2690967 RepID=UPI00131365C4|nr:hypothetical protein [Natrialba sp. INN-245]MWV39546.1 hypothetical protein [Natrialba sp. INN-245]